MSAILPISIFLVAFSVGRCLDPENYQETEDDAAYWKALSEDIVKEHKQIRYPIADTPEACYPGIGCFSPKTGLNTINSLYPYSPHDMDTKFYLYTLRNYIAPKELHYERPDSLQAKEFHPEVPVVVIVHGFRDNGLSQWIVSMKTQLLKSHDVNIIAVDWQNGVSYPLYGQAIANGELVSRQIARVLVLLKEKRGYDITKTHLIGYSLGAHVAGFTSKYLKQLGEGQVARISGLDAAGPLFGDKDEKVHLSYHDANFVDAIHTSASNESLARALLSKKFGILKPIGHVDFYPNGGTGQPGCRFLEWACSHGRAPILYTESINSKCAFTSHACGGHDDYNAGKCSHNETARMGYHSNAGNARGVFYLNTGSEPPYCILKK